MNFSSMPTQMKVILGAVAVTIVAAFLPWASAFGISVAGVRGDGVITLVVAIIGGALVLANRGGRMANALAQLVLGGLVVVVAVYHVNDEFAAIGVYLTLLAGLVWMAALAWWWFSAQPSFASPSPESLARPLEPAPLAEEVAEGEGGRDRPAAS